MSVIQKWLFSQPLMLNGSNPVGNWDMGSDKITIKASLSFAVCSSALQVRQFHFVRSSGGDIDSLHHNWNSMNITLNLDIYISLVLFGNLKAGIFEVFKSWRTKHTTFYIVVEINKLALLILAPH